MLKTKTHLQYKQQKAFAWNRRRKTLLIERLTLPEEETGHELCLMLQICLKIYWNLCKLKKPNIDEVRDMFNIGLKDGMLGCGFKSCISLQNK